MVQFQQAEDTEIQDDALVQNQLTGLLDSNSAYMQQATTRGNQEAQSRGLLSSSIAAGAVEDSRISAALPIAQQDAQTYANASLQDSAYNQQVSLNDQGYNQQLGLNDQTFDQNTQLNEQNFGYQQDLNDQTFGQQAQLNQNQFQYDLQLNSQNNSAQASLQQQNQIAEMQLNMNSQIAQIEQNPQMSTAQQSSAINNLITLNNASVSALQTGGQLSNVSYTYNGQPAGSVTSKNPTSNTSSSSGPPYAAPSGYNWIRSGGEWKLIYAGNNN